MKPIAPLPLLFAGILLTTLVMESCAPKIQGARPHRRDRHCGCENVPAQTDTTTCLIAEKTY